MREGNMATVANKMTFLPVGRVVVTANANEALMHEDIIAALDRHQVGDWGEVCESDRKANNKACKYGERILSAYTGIFGDKFWVRNCSIIT